MKNVFFCIERFIRYGPDLDFLFPRKKRFVILTQEGSRRGTELLATGKFPGLVTGSRLRREDKSLFQNPKQVLQRPGFTLPVGWLGLVLMGSGLLACAPGASTRPKKLRLSVGELKEITLPTPADSSVQVLATSENPEVVDVSRLEALNDSTTLTKGRPVRMNFLLKGVTAGTARVVFSEKPAGPQAPDRIRRTYLVEVVNK